MAHRILLADDSLTIQKVVELTFAGAEWDLRAVGNGDKAAGLLAEHEPDIVLADAVMPGLTGYELCEAVKRLPYGAYIPVVMLTGTFEPFDRPRADRAGADAVVTKPFDSHALLALVRDLVTNAKEARAAAPPPLPPSPPPPPEPEPEPEPATVEAEPESRSAEAPPVAPGFEVAPPGPEFEAELREASEETSPTKGFLILPSEERPSGPEALYATSAMPIATPEGSEPAAPSVETTAEVAAEPFREAELPLMPSGPPPSPGFEVDLGGLEDEVPRRDVEVDIARYERLASGHEERPVFAPPVDETEAASTSVELPPAGGQLPESPASELETLAASASLTDLTRIVGAAPGGDRPLTDDDVERVARRVVEILGERVVRKVAWDVVPEMAERLVRERLRELERAD